MEPLLAGDPTELGGCQIRGRLWTSGALTAFQAERDGESVAVLAVKNGPQVTDVAAHNARIAELSQSLQGASTGLGAAIIGGGSSGEYSYLISQLPQGKNLRDTIYSGKLLSPAVAAALVESADQILTDYSGQARILVTPDTVFVDNGHLSFMGLGAIELLDASATPGASLGVNALEWFAPETLAEGSWTNASAKFSLAASLFAASAASPWREPVRQLNDLFRRSIDIGKLQNNPQLESLFPWLNARPDLRVLEVSTDEQEEIEEIPAPVNSTPLITTSESQPTSQPASQPASKRGMYIMIGVVSAALIAAFAAIGISTLGGSSDTTASTSTESTTAEEDSETTDTSTPEPTPTPETTPDPEYQVKLDYSSDSIPNQPPTDGLQFTFDVCSGDSEWLSKAFTDDVRLQFKVGDKWTSKPSVPKVVKGGRCDNDQYNLTITHIVAVPEGTEPDGIWSDCLSYRVNLPETDNFQKFSVPFCASVRQTA